MIAAELVDSRTPSTMADDKLQLTGGASVVRLGMKTGWQIRTLGEILDKTETVNPLQSPDTEFNYIDVSSVSNTTFQIEQTQRLKGKDAPSRARKLVKTDDVIFATIRPTLRRIAVVPSHLDKQVCSTGYFVLRPKPLLHHRFLYYWLFADDFMNQMESLQKGASYPAVTDKEVRDQAIPFPPLTEQIRIVAILDEAFDGIAAAKANAEKNLQNAREIFDGYLESVINECANECDEQRLDAICEVKDGTHASPEYVDDGIAFVTQKNIRDDGLSLANTRFIRQIDHDNYYRRSNVGFGDILISMIGANRGMACLVDDARTFSIKNVGLVKKNDRFNPNFLLYFLRSRRAAKYVRSASRGGAQEFIGLTALRSFPINIPSLSVQNELVAKFDSLTDETTRLESLYRQKLTYLDCLKKSMLDLAFNGNL